MKWQKHITEEPIRKHFISMPWTVVSSKPGVNFITIIVGLYYVLLKCARKQLLEVQIEHLFVYTCNTNVILLVIYIIIVEIIPNNHNLILTMVITCMSTVKSLGQPRSYMYQPLAVCCGSHHNWCAILIVNCAGIEWKYNYLKKNKIFWNFYQNLISCL